MTLSATKDRRHSSGLLSNEKERAIHALLAEYVRVVDDRRLEDWPKLFAREAQYFVIPRDNYDRGLPLALIYDDSRDRIEDRVTYIKKVWVDHFDDYQPRHFVSNIVVRQGDEEHLAALAANVAIYATLADGTSQLLAVGEYIDTVVFEEGVPRFRDKRVVLDTTVLPRSFVYPL